MSIHYDMTNLQEGFTWGIPNSDDSKGGGKEIEKQSLLLQPFEPSENLIPMAKKGIKGKKRAKRDGKDHIDDDGESQDHEIHIWTERERRKKMRNMFNNLHTLLPQLPPKADKSTIVDEAVNTIKNLEQTLAKLQSQKLEKLEKLQYSSSTSTTPTTTFPIVTPYDPSSSSSPTTLITPLNQTQILPQNSITTTLLTDQISSDVTGNLPYPCNNPNIGFDTWTSNNLVLNICGNEGVFNLCCPKNKLGFFTNVCYVLEKYNIEVVTANVSSNVYRKTYMIQTQVKQSYENRMVENGVGVGEIFKQAAQEIMMHLSS